jgi:hypothetical protein
MESDFKFNDGHTIIIPCKPNAQMTFDFIIPSANDFARIVDTTKQINEAVELINKFNPEPNTKAAIKIATFVVGIATDILGMDAITSKYQENSALYNLKVQVEEGSESYYPDSRVKDY